MEYEAFKGALLKALEESLGESIGLEYGMVQHNNGKAYEGLHILNPGKKLMPVFNVEDYYRMYFEEEKDFDGIVGEILDKIENPEIEQENMTCRVDRLDEVMENVYFALVNYEANRERLKEVPHERFLDLAIVLYLCMNRKGNHYLTMMITAPLMRRWGTDFDTLYGIARKNTVEKHPAEIMELKEIFRMMMIEKLKKDMGDTEQEMDDELIEGTASIITKAVLGTAATHKSTYFMSNSPRLFGAACILYPGVLQKLAEKVGADLYIAPVSVHEVMIFPDLDVDAQWLRERVALASGESEGEKEWLSSHLYVYRRLNEEVELIE